VIISATYLYAKNQGVEIISKEQIIIQCVAKDAFKILTHTDYIDRISTSVGAIKLNKHGYLEKGDRYERTFFSHGIPNKQKVLVEALIPDSSLTIQTDLLGYTVTYDYVLVALENNQTALTLTKTRSGSGVLPFLLKHLLTRPEHDGLHFLRVKEVSELEAKNGN
jgi:hypothetical protein